MIDTDQFVRDAFVGIYDYSYAPFALGDAVTWQINCAIGAAEHGRKTVVRYVVADPSWRFHVAQTYITENNYREHLNGLFPIFLCSPQESSLYVVSDKNSFDRFLLTRIAGRSPTWPSLASHWAGNLDLTSYDAINRFYRKNGFIPRLKEPAGYAPWLELFRQTYQDRFIVTVHIRQRRSYPDAGFQRSVNFVRDSDSSSWYRFFRVIGEKYPDVLFVIPGAVAEWNRELYRFPNVRILRTMGCHLGHELALLLSSDLFMGTSSGFSSVATFAEIPYVITNMEDSTAEPWQVEIGSPKLRFALADQVLSWEKETVDRLLGLFEMTYGKWRCAAHPHAARRRTGVGGL